MKKWHTVLWAVFISLALGSGIGLWRARSPHDMTIGSVNGNPVYLDAYRKALTDIHARLNMLRPYARLYGISEEMLFKNILGMSNPEAFAVDMCVRDALIDDITSRFNVRINDEVFKEELVRSMPEGITDEQGYISMEAYQQYLNKISTTPREFEERRMKELKRELVQQTVAQSFYVPRYMAKEAFEAEYNKKSFVVAVVPFSRFLHEAEKTEVSDGALKVYYEKNRENYRIPEKRKAKIWQVSAEEYALKLDIDDEMIKNFYERNKSKLFRIAPKIKVRRILIKDAKKAQEVMKEVKAAPEKFAEFAKKYSQDEATVKNGGLLDFFGRGTHDPAFEREAFKLQNSGEISRLVKTAKGNEIIQLVERQKAEEKPLEAVRDEIIKTMRTKRAVSVLRGDLETMMHNAINDSAVFGQFVQAHKFEGKDTDWLTAQDANSEKDKVLSVLAQKLFAPSKRMQSCGYFVVEGKYVLYQLTDLEKSVVPSLEKARNHVLKDYQEAEASRALDKMVGQVKAEVLDKKSTLEEAAATFGLKVIKTGIVAKDDKPWEGLDKDNMVSKRAFVLSDMRQVLQHYHDKDFYLVQLREVAPASNEEFTAKKSEMIKKQKLNGPSTQVGAFIASLQRNAKININEKKLMKLKQVRD